MPADILIKRKEKLRSGLGKDILFTLASQIAIMVLMLVVNKILSVKLGVEGYGQYSIIKKNTQVVSFVMLCGIGIALPRYLSAHIAQKILRKPNPRLLPPYWLYPPLLSFAQSVAR
jgi:hypothetical protein